MLIDGRFYGSPCDQEVGKGPAHSPYDGKIIGSAAEAGWSEVSAALDGASRAFETWRNSPLRERIALLRRIAVLVRERRQELAELMADEIGKPLGLAGAELDRTALTFDLAADLLTQPVGQVLAASYDGRGDGVRLTVERFPIGPVFAISPYNWPFMLAAHKIAPALAAGTTVVLKGSPMAAMCTLALGRLIHDAGCPDGVVNVIQCEAVLAEKAIRDDRVKMVSFTGSDAVGWRIKSLVPKKRVLLELGGDAAAIVLKDGDLDAAMTGCAKSAFGYAGQVCISLQRLYIEEAVWDECLAKLTAATEAIPYGAPKEPGVWCGPMIHSGHADRVMAWLEEAEQAGAKILAGGNRVGNVIQPTLLTDVPASVKLGCEEVFGPVLVVEKVSGLAEGIARANASRYGIHASVYTQSLKAADEAYRKLEVGGVVINDIPNTRFDGMPYGGVKDSGFGREGLQVAMEEMTEPKVLVLRS